MLWCDSGVCCLLNFWCVMGMVVGDFICLNCRDVNCMFVWLVCFFCLDFHLFLLIIFSFIFCFILCIVRFVIYSVVVREIGWGRICDMFFGWSWLVFDVVYLDFFYFWFLVFLLCKFCCWGINGWVGYYVFQLFRYEVWFISSCYWVRFPIMCEVEFVFSFITRPIGRVHFIFIFWVSFVVWVRFGFWGRTLCWGLDVGCV